MDECAESPVKATGFIGLVGLVCSAALCLVCVVVLVGWLGGDLNAWSKWLSWVPAPALLLVPILGLVVGSRQPGRTARSLRAMNGLLAVFLLSWTLGVEYGILRARPVLSSDFVLVHWNASWPSRRKLRLNEAYDAVRLMDADLVVVTEVGQFGWGEEGSDLKSEWPHVARTSTVSLLSREPFLEARTILFNEGVSLVLVRLEMMGEERSMWVVDLPSTPSRPKGPIFQRLLDAVDEAGLPDPDIVVGDFNVTRHSRALHAAFPSMRNAFSEAGVGWSGSWPRRWPLWQLDQILVGPDLQCRRYELIDPGVGRHRMQRAVLRDRPEFGSSSSR
jgi:endonuclease/exonuclease/phosphatase family metal-dependent hydrolase